MSIQDQVEAAWKKYRPEALSTNSMSLSHDVFTAGYLAALRSLFVEVKPGEVSAGVDYWILRDGEWRDAWWFSDRLALGEAMNCERILKLNLPSPSDLFTEGVPQ